MRVLPHQLCSRRAYASQVDTSIPALRRPCTPPAGFWAAPGFASLAPFSNNRTPALRQNNSAQPRPAKKARLKPLATACDIQNEAGLASLQFASMHLPLRNLVPRALSTAIPRGRNEQENGSHRDSGPFRSSRHPGGARRPLRRKREIGRAHRAIHGPLHQRRYRRRVQCRRTEFASGFKGCTLDEVRYDDEVETTFLDEMLAHGQKGEGDLIVVLSEFTTDWRAADGGFSPNERYEDWQWILTRPSQDAPWKVVDWGY